MSNTAEQAAYLIGPHTGKVSVLPLTTTTAGLDLSATTELGTAVDSGKFVSFQADGADVYLFLASSNAGTVDPTITAAGDAQRAYLIPNGQERMWIPRSGFHFVRARAGTGTGYLRMYVSSKPPNELAEG